SGTPLTDTDRWPWLERLSLALKGAAERDEIAVGACSALKRAYRDYMTKIAGEPILFVYLEGTKDVIAARIAAPKHEVTPASLRDSQLATLEVPAADENALPVPVTETVDEIVARIISATRRG